MRDRRSEVRMMCADVVQTSWIDPNGQLQQADALLEDISPSGASLQFEIQIPSGVTLRVACPKRELVGEVRYCVYREIGYFVGIEFDRQSHWSKRSFKPRHLLDLHALVEAARKRD